MSTEPLHILLQYFGGWFASVGNVHCHICYFPDSPLYFHVAQQVLLSIVAVRNYQLRKCPCVQNCVAKINEIHVSVGIETNFF